MSDKDLLTRAYGDIICADAILAYPLIDEIQYDVVCYHIQQAVEKTLKFQLMCNGVEFPLTHNIARLCEALDDHGIAYPTWVYDNRNVLLAYATETRYGTQLVAVKREMLELLELARGLVAQQQKELL